MRFLARRLVIPRARAGNADPNASVGGACATACEIVGLPECKLNLAQTVCYLAVAPKSNAATNAIFAAIADLREGKILPVPRSLRDAHYGGAAALGHTGYQYAHDAPDAIAAQDYLGVEKEYYIPTDRGAEKEIGERLEKIREILRTAKGREDVRTNSSKGSA